MILTSVEIFYISRTNKLRQNASKLGCFLLTESRLMGILSSLESDVMSFGANCFFTEEIIGLANVFCSLDVNPAEDAG